MRKNLNIFGIKPFMNKVYYKDYIEFFSIYKVSEICMEAQTHLSESDFQYVLDILWKRVAIAKERYS